MNLDPSYFRALSPKPENPKPMRNMPTKGLGAMIFLDAGARSTRVEALLALGGLRKPLPLTMSPLPPGNKH